MPKTVIYSALLLLIIVNDAEIWAKSQLIGIYCAIVFEKYGAWVQSMYNTVCPSMMCEIGDINKNIIGYSFPVRGWPTGCGS